MLLNTLAGANAELRKELQKLLGKDTFDTVEPAKPAPAAPAPTVAPTTTKH